MKKRVISWLLTVVMVVSLLPTSVLADTLAADQEQQTQQEQIAPVDTENTVPAGNEETQEQQEPAPETPAPQMTRSGGAALALAASNGLAFLYRSITGQMYYRTVASYPKTISGFLLAFAVTAIGTLLWQHFFIKFALVGVILFIYCTLYRAQLARLWSMGLGILRGIFHRK